MSAPKPSELQLACAAISRNARLIGLIPELLAALTDVGEFICRTDCEHGHSDTCKRISSLIERSKGAAEDEAPVPLPCRTCGPKTRFVLAAHGAGFNAFCAECAEGAESMPWGKTGAEAIREWNARIREEGQ